MKLSAFSVVDAFPSEEAAKRDRYSELLALGDAADAADLSAFWVAEHHFQPGGVLPSPPIALAAVAARTRRLRLGAMVSVLPFHAPVEIAEQYALVDQLSHGRLNFGVGSGYLALELEAFGVPASDKRERFDAALATILRAWVGEPVRPAGPHGPEVALNVRPVQTPHPPLWIAVQRKEAIPFVARRGASLALIPYATVSGLDELAEEIRLFRSAAPAGVKVEVAIGVHLYAGDHPARARAALRQYLATRLATQSTFYADKARRDPAHATPEAIEKAGFALFGRPAEVADRLSTFQSLGVDEVLGLFDFGGLPADDVRSSVAALGARWSAQAG